MKVRIQNQRFNEGLGFKTIAKNLGISKNTVKSYVKHFKRISLIVIHCHLKNTMKHFLLYSKKNTMEISNRKSKLITKDIDIFIRKCLL